MEQQRKIYHREKDQSSNQVYENEYYSMKEHLVSSPEFFKLNKMVSRSNEKVQDHLEKDTTIVDVHSRNEQLQHDLEILAIHVEKMEKKQQEDLEEKNVLRTLLHDVEKMNQQMKEERESILLENEALKKQNRFLQENANKWEDRALIASETQEELLLALKEQQVKEIKIQEQNTQLMTELTTIQRLLQQNRVIINELEKEREKLENHNHDLQQKFDSEYAKISQMVQGQESTQDKQQKIIEGLRSDLLQFEFEYRTLLLDKERLMNDLKKLEKKVQAKNPFIGCVETIPTAFDDNVAGSHPFASRSPVAKKFQVKRSKLMSNEDKFSFTNVMELPNFIADDNEKPSRIGAIVTSFSSAKKKLFSSNSLILPQ
jgi:peptidoglycan hydrolase CwlO-like protein